MSENSKIEWTDHTFIPWEGCQKVGPGCDHCYAETRNARFGGGTAINWGPGAPRRRTSAANWRKPLHWNAVHGNFLYQHGRRQRVFCASLADVFDNAVDPTWRADLFALIKQTPNLDWLLLTKRIGNVPAMLAEIGVEGLPWNVWLGATIVNQEEADRDIPKLLAVPARVRFLSMEPLLGPVTFRWASWVDHDAVCKRDGKVNHLEGLRGIDWVIAGGESGHGARPMNPDWASEIQAQCEAASVAFLFKQWGEWYPASIDSEDDRIWLPDGSRAHMFDEDGNARIQSHRWSSSWSDPVTCYSISAKIGKKAAGRLLNGRTHDEFPA